MYSNEKVTVDRAAEIAGLNTFVFLDRLQREGIRFVDADTEPENEQAEDDVIDYVFQFPV